MANLAVRKSASQQPTAIEWDPFQMMREMMRWDPFREITPILPESARVFSPAFEIKETKEGFIIKADVPGIAEKDLDVTITGNRLTVSGKREAEETKKDDTFYTYERSYGSFTRSFTLPDGSDPEHVKAEMRDGVVTIQVPKTPEAQPKKIAVKAEKAKA